MFYVLKRSKLLVAQAKAKKKHEIKITIVNTNFYLFFNSFFNVEKSNCLFFAEFLYLLFKLNYFSI